MFDAFPYDEWSDQITTFWTYGVEGDTGTIILTILGVLLIPMLYVAVEKAIGGEKKHTPTPAGTPAPALAGASHGSH